MSFHIATIPTTPFEGQKTGTSGLRKKVKVFAQHNYLNNWVQSLFSALGADLVNKTIVLGGDGRYWSTNAIDIILRVAAANGVAKVVIGQNGILCTPALSSVIRELKLFGGIILTASHNPGGPDEDFGIKYNGDNGGPAQESLTDKIFDYTVKITEYHYAVVSHDDTKTSPFEKAGLDLSQIGTTKFTSESPKEGFPAEFVVEVIDSTDVYVNLFKTMFDFNALKNLLARSDFNFLFDAMSGVTGPYAQRIFVKELGADAETSLMRCEPLPDFGGHHPDPNLTYAAELVERLDPTKSQNAPDMGAASDGDGDRNMILGKGFFVTPSDSVAVIAAYATKKGVIPYFDKSPLKGAARSMPTASALDHVANKLGIECFETPTGWKFFGNLMDAGRAQICGEESFGTGSDHVREKDGIFAVLCWLSILAYENKDPSKPLVSIEKIVTDHWAQFGRNYFSRYDYENCESDGANAMMKHIAALQDTMNANKSADGQMSIDDSFPTKVVVADDFSYTDPIDGSTAKGQGKRFIFEDHSRIVFRLSGTGSSGATIRVYVEKYEANPAKQNLDAQVALKPFIDLALSLSQLQNFTGRDAPTVIT